MKFDWGSVSGERMGNIYYSVLLSFLLYFNAIIKDMGCRDILLSKVK